MSLGDAVRVTPSPGDRYRTLDSMRGVAAVVVVMYHASFAVGGWAPRFSFLAVDLFFCLSGFVIAKNYDPRFAVGLGSWQFMRLRLRRLFPLYFLGWCAAAATLLIPSTAHPIDPPWSLSITLALNLLFLPGFSQILFPLNIPSWSLFFELWVANLLFALSWRFLNRTSLSSLLIISSFLLLYIERSSHDLDIGFDYATLGGGLARVFYSFFAGVVISRIHAVYPLRLKIPSVVIISIMLILMSLPFDGRLRALHQMFCILVAFPALIYCGASATERRPQWGKALGDASYAVYVLHAPMLVLGIWLFRGSVHAVDGYGLQIGLVVAATLVALVLHHAYDVPIRQRLAARRRSRG